MKKILDKIKLLDVHTLEVVQKSASATIVKVAGMLIGLAVSISLGHIIGAEGVGIIGLANKCVAITMIIALLGVPQVIVKRVAIAKNQNDNADIGNVMLTATMLNGVSSILLTTALIIISPIISEKIFNEPKLTVPLVVFAIVMPAQVFSRVFSSGLIGYKKIWQSNLVDQTLSVAITGILVLVTWLFEYSMTEITIAIYYAIGRVFVTITTGVYWRFLFKPVAKMELIIKEITKTSMPLLLVAVTLLLAASIDSLMLGWLSSTKEVGYYTVALQLAMLTSFFLQVANSTLMPKIAALYEANRVEEMKKMVQKTTVYLSIVGISTVFVFLLLGKYLLGLWGLEFINAYEALIILSVGQFLNIATGPVGSILMMCGYEKTLQNITIVSLVLNIILNYLLIPRLGSTGAAIATTVTIAVIMIVSIIFVKKNLGFYTLIIRRLKK